MTNRPRRPIAFVATLALGAPVALLLVWPQAFHAQQAPLVTQLVAFRAGGALALGVLALVAAAVALARRRWAVAAATAIVLGAASLSGGAIALGRGGGATDALPEGGLRVVAWNTQGGAASPASIARLVLETRADIVSLPETDAEAAGEAVRLLAAEGRRMRAATAHGDTGESEMPTSLLVDERLGEYRVDAPAGSTPGLPSARWQPADGTGPVIVAAHPMPPLPSVLDDWRAGLEWVAQQCRTPDVIVAGDLNATLDHLSALRGEALVAGCRDAAAESGAAGVGTWPATVPTWLAAPIDHVLVGPAWAVRGAEVVTTFDAAGSDHRPIVAVLDPR